MEEQIKQSAMDGCLENVNEEEEIMSKSICELEGEEIGRMLNTFLESISLESRLIFLRRYWFADSIEEIAARYRISQSKVKTQLHRTRRKLQLFLEKEGIMV